MSANMIVKIWNESSDITEFKSKAAGISYDNGSIDEFENYLRGSFGEVFQAKELVDSIADILKKLNR